MDTTGSKIKTSLNGVNFIKREEEFRSKPYLDSVGVPTIGYGSTRYENGKAVTLKDMPITEQRASELLANTLIEYEVSVNKTVKASLNQNQFDALVSFAYNVGTGGMSTSTLAKKININPRDPDITYWFSVWNKGTVKGKKVVLPGLVNRRKRESQLYFK